MVFLDFSIFPVDKGPSLSIYVARSLTMIGGFIPPLCLHV